MQFRDHIGKQVEVVGVLRTQQEVATTSTTDRAGKPTATSGTPTVSTQTELDLKRLEAREVTEIGGRCEG